MFFEDNQLERYGLIDGDVLVCEGGEPGRAAVWNGKFPDMKYQKALHRVRCCKGYEPRMLVVLLEHLAKSGRLEKWFTGSTIKHFTRESFVQLPVPLPSISEQKVILEEIDCRLSVTEELETTIETNLKRAERLRQTILQRAFSGGLP
jgi:type I restriction enzyme S subunit